MCLCITSLRLSFGLPMFRCPLPSIFYVFVATSSSAFVFTCPNHLGRALTFSLMFSTTALVLISSVMIYSIYFIPSTCSCLLVLQVYQQVLNEQCQSLMESLVSSIAADRSAMENISSSGDVNKLMYRVNGVRWHWPTSSQWHSDSEDTCMCITMTHLPKRSDIVTSQLIIVKLASNIALVFLLMIAYKPTNLSD